MEQMTFEDVMKFLCVYLGQSESAWLRFDQDLRFVIGRAVTRYKAAGVEFCKRDAIHLAEAWEMAERTKPFPRPVFAGM
jgi:hypothetical protein